MNCPKCKSTKEMCNSQAYYKELGIPPIYLCTSCGCSILKRIYFDSPFVYAPYIPKIVKEDWDYDKVMAREG
jgi:hypothetical protein